MSFLIYFFVLLVSAASVLFGLDLMSSPLPTTPNVPIGRSVQTVAQPPLPQRDKRAADERALTPVYPAAPGKPKVQAEAKLPPSPATPQTNQTPAAAPANAEPIEAAAQPAAQQTPSSCNVQVCGGAYYSFRASDCSYQPAAGPRRTCTRPGGAERIVRRQPLRLAPYARQIIGQGGQGEMSESERIVRQMTRNESGDIPVQDAYGNIIIVHKSYR